MTWTLWSQIMLLIMWSSLVVGNIIRECKRPYREPREMPYGKHPRP